jgi:hypothetical protein
MVYKLDGLKRKPGDLKNLPGFISIKNEEIIPGYSNILHFGSGHLGPMSCSFQELVLEISHESWYQESL